MDGMSKEEFDQTIHDVLNTTVQPQQIFSAFMSATLMEIFHILLHKSEDELQKLLNQLRDEVNP